MRGRSAVSGRGSKELRYTRLLYKQEETYGEYHQSVRSEKGNIACDAVHPGNGLHRMMNGGVWMYENS